MPQASNVSSAVPSYPVGPESDALLGFYGSTPVAKPASVGAYPVTDASGGTAASTNGILTLTGTYNSTIIANAIATLAHGYNGIQQALVSLGLIAGT